MSSSDLRERGVSIVANSTLPVEVQYVAKQLGIGWATARNILQSLVIEGKIVQLQTTSGRLLFYLTNNESKGMANLSTRKREKHLDDKKEGATMGLAATPSPSQANVGIQYGSKDK